MKDPYEAAEALDRGRTRVMILLLILLVLDVAAAFWGSA